MQAMDTDGSARQTRRAFELLHSGMNALRDEIADRGAFARAIDRVDRVMRTSNGDVAAIEEALSHALAIGRAVYETLDPRAQQSVEALSHAQQLFSAPPPAVRADDRRASPRALMDVEITFTSDDNFYAGFSEDISDGGIFVATYDLAPIGTRIELEFTLPDGHVVHTHGEVRWLRDLRDESEDVRPGMGIQFRELLPEDALAIAEFVAARAPIFYDE